MTYEVLAEKKKPYSKIHRITYDADCENFEELCRRDYNVSSIGFLFFSGHGIKFETILFIYILCNCLFWLSRGHPLWSILKNQQLGKEIFFQFVTKFTSQTGFFNWEQSDTLAWLDHLKIQFVSVNGTIKNCSRVAS